MPDMTAGLVTMQLGKDFSPGGSSFLIGSKPDWTRSSIQRDRGITVILRTHNRPEFLVRAVRNVAAQQYPDLALCIVNDGGNAQLVETIVYAELPTGGAVEFIHNRHSVGQVAALNLAFARIRREFFAVHDDDDTWSPSYLAAMAGFLLDPKNSNYIGVACHADVLREEVQDGQIITRSTRQHHRYGPLLSLFELLNFYSHPPPISVVMRSASIEIAPLNNPAMQVMYDCEWLIRVLLHADVAVLPDALAYYHLREGDQPELGAARNSVFEFRDEFDRLRILIQNELLRAELATGKLGVGFTSSLLHHLNDKMRHLNDKMRPPISDQAASYLDRKAKRYFRRRALIQKIEAKFKWLKTWGFGTG